MTWTLIDLERDAEDVVDTVIDLLEDEYGDNVRVSYKVTKEDKLTDSELNEIREGVNDRYELARKSVTEGYDIDADITVKGDDDEMTSETSAYIVKIDGRLVSYRCKRPSWIGCRIRFYCLKIQNIIIIVNDPGSRRRFLKKSSPFLYKQKLTLSGMQSSIVGSILRLVQTSGGEPFLSASK